MAAALQFPLFHPAVCSVIPGARTADQIKGNIKTLILTYLKTLGRDEKPRSDCF